MTRRTAVAFALAVLAAAPAPSGAATVLNGDYTLTLDIRKNQRFFPWDWESNNGENWAGANFRLFSQPRPNIEAFLRFEADWNPGNNSSLRPEFQYREAHMRFARTRADRGVEAYVFSRQDRYWVDNYLIQTVQGGALGAGGSQGIRLNTWGHGGVFANFIVSDFSDQYSPLQPNSALTATDNAYVARLRREFLGRQLRLGFTWNRRVEDEPADSTANALVSSQVYHFDARYRFRGADYSAEWAQSQSPIPAVLYPGALNRELTVFGQGTGIHLPDNAVLEAEIRTLTVGNSRTGYFNLVPRYWNRGPTWQNRLGGPARDETGFLTQFYWVLPERAVTLTYNHIDASNEATQKRRYTEDYYEAYIEFVNGFTGKSYLRQRDETRREGALATLEEHDDFFAELQVESRLAWLLVQTKIRDLGTPDEKQLFAVASSINLRSDLKLYNRFVFANDATILRKGIFMQLQYRPSSTVEMYLQYGTDYIGGGSVPVDDGNLAGNADQADILKFILRGSF
jgi:hypothetical protein